LHIEFSQPSPMKKNTISEMKCLPPGCSVDLLSN
jgi:hypothetical protein